MTILMRPAGIRQSADSGQRDDESSRRSALIHFRHFLIGVVLSPALPPKHVPPLSTASLSRASGHPPATHPRPNHLSCAIRIAVLSEETHTTKKRPVETGIIDCRPMVGQSDRRVNSTRKNLLVLLCPASSSRLSLSGV